MEGGDNKDDGYYGTDLKISYLKKSTTVKK